MTLRALPIILTALIVASTTFTSANDVAPPPKPETNTEKLPGQGSTVTFDMVRVPGGTFVMRVGDLEKTVTVKPFWIGKTEVTWDEFDVYQYGFDLPAKTERERAQALFELVVAQTRPSRPYFNPGIDFGHARYPVISIHYEMAKCYCRWLSSVTGKRYRLPTEAEWEWAARGGTHSTQPPADKLSLLRHAWAAENSSTEEHPDGKTHLVASRSPNALGLYDMYGNAAEWTLTSGDLATTVYAAVFLPASKETPYARGGSYRTRVADLHPGFRYPYRRHWQSRDPQDPQSVCWLSDAPFVGFRVVRED